MPGRCPDAVSVRGITRWMVDSRGVRVHSQIMSRTDIAFELGVALRDLTLDAYMASLTTAELVSAPWSTLGSITSRGDRAALQAALSTIIIAAGAAMDRTRCGSTFSRHMARMAAADVALTTLTAAAL